MPAQIITLIFLIIYTAMDLKYRRVYWPLGAGMLAFAFVFHLIFSDISVTGMLIGMLPGAGLAGISALTGGSVGMGDALAVGVCGAFLGFEYSFQILLLALVLSALPAAVTLLRKGKEAKDVTFPFLPFLLAGQILLMCLSARFG